jgi:antitoxin ParD1/3/4
VDKNQIQSGRFTNDSEYIRVLLRQDQELNSNNDGIRKALIEGEKSGEAKLLNANEFKAKMAAKYV